MVYKKLVTAILALVIVIVIGFTIEPLQKTISVYATAKEKPKSETRVMSSTQWHSLHGITLNQAYFSDANTLERYRFVSKWGSSGSNRC